MGTTQLYHGMASSTTLSSSSLTSGTVALCSVGRAPKSGNLQGFSCFKTNAAGSGSTLNVRLETATGGFTPTGTLFHANGTGSANVSGVGQVTANFAGLVPVTKGDIIATVAYAPSPSAGISIARAIVDTLGGRTTSPQGPLNARTNASYSVGSGTGWATPATSSIPCIGPTYEDGTTLDGILLISGAVSMVPIPASGAGSYSGIKFTPGSKFRAEGVFATGRFEAALTIQLIDSSNNILRSISVPSGQYAAVAGCLDEYFSSPIDLEAGSTYRIVILNPSGTANQYHFTIPMSSQNHIDDALGIACLTASSNGTSWTDTAGQFPCISPIGNFMASSSGGIILNTGMTGGFGN